MSDEANFLLNGSVNKQNCRIYANENPHVIQKVPLYKNKITIWCGVSAKTIIGSFFFENEDGQAAAVNQERYRDMIATFVMPVIRRKHVRRFWFRQDGAPQHTALIPIDFLKKFSSRQNKKAVFNFDINK